MAIKISIVIGIVLWQGHLFKNLEGDPFATRKVRQKLLLGGNSRRREDRSAYLKGIV
jgi:hypothetical protein